ncbi:MAG: ABC transporter ATP-binding protein [Planctomycetaceae bacterium]|nr:ABC transporter ATP-binding protein [Planctomycetaceae bacterium]
MSALEARNLTCGYGQRRVLEALSLSAQAGEVLVLLGPNGAGKTTLLRALARFIRPMRGSVLLHDQDIWRYRADEAAQRVALMPQNERRDWPLTVEESVRLGRAPHRGWLLPYTEEDRQIVESALVGTGLQELRQRPITELSGGEWRRMIFARALAQQASVLLLDEPTAGLDLKYQHEVLKLARQLANGRGLTVVLTLHDLNHAALYGDRLAVIAEHTLVSLGRPQEVMTADLIHRVFGVRATVIPHPVYGTPMVVPLTDDLSECSETVADVSDAI